MVDLLERLARVESPSSDPQAQRAVASLLGDEFQRVGMHVRAARGHGVGDHLFAYPRDRVRGSGFQLISGHMDTVWPTGTLTTMPVRRDGEQLFGPGVFDMKGGLVVMIYALRTLAEMGIAPSATPVVFVGTDEEIGSPDSRRMLDLLARSAQRAFILEAGYGPTGRLKTSRKGVGIFTITVRGHAVHSGLEPREGVSAIHELAHQIQKLSALTDHDRGVSVNVGIIEGGMASNMVAPLATAVVDVRAPTLADAAEIEAAIRAITPVDPRTTLRVEGRFGRLPMEDSPRNRALYEQAVAVGRELGMEIDEVSVGGGSDGNITSLRTATLDGLGPIGDGAHRTDEHIFISSLPERAALLALLLAAPLERHVLPGAETE
jgi:glutamate carboxypeptidase